MIYFNETKKAVIACHSLTKDVWRATNTLNDVIIERDNHRDAFAAMNDMLDNTLDEGYLSQKRMATFSV